MNINKNKLLPFVLTVVVIVLDQITKMLVARYIEWGNVGFQFLGDFLRIIHVSNKGVAFSMGDNMPDNIRHILFGIAPIVVIGIIIAVYLRNDDWTKLQRWAVCGIVGGGIGNVIDRFFRSEGVVDFIDIKFFGIFGLKRWPTFNVADSAVVVCGIILLVSFVVSIVKEKKSDNGEIL